MAKEDSSDDGKSEAFAACAATWAAKHLTSPDNPPCPICFGTEWTFVSSELRIGTISVYPRYCPSCGYTMFINAEMVK